MKKYGKNIYINEDEENILTKYGINVSTCNTLEEVLLLIDRYLTDEILDDSEYDELDYVGNILNERLYYMGMK